VHSAWDGIDDGLSDAQAGTGSSIVADILKTILNRLNVVSIYTSLRPAEYSNGLALYTACSDTPSSPTSPLSFRATYHESRMSAPGRQRR
jgi:hypothetical protein